MIKSLGKFPDGQQIEFYFREMHQEDKNPRLYYYIFNSNRISFISMSHYMKNLWNVNYLVKYKYD